MSSRLAFTFIWHLSARWHAYWHTHRQRVNAEATFYSSKDSYGQLRDLVVRDETMRIGLRRTRAGNSTLVLDLERRQIDGSVIGSLDGWPFLDDNQWFNVTKAYFHTTGSLEIWKLHGGFRINPLPSLSGGIGAHLFRAIPRLNFTTWELDILALGMKNEEERSLSVDEMDGLLISAGVNVSVADLTISVSAIQLLPLRVHKSSLSTKKISFASSQGSLRTSGGQMLQAQISYSL